jgi:hypothetical protein
MGMEVADLARKFGSEHERLSEASEAIAAGIAEPIPEPAPTRCRIARKMSRRAPAVPDAPRLVMEVFREVMHRRPDFPVDGMDMRIGRSPQGDEADVEAPLFERVHFLRDEGFGKAGIALEDEGDCRCGGLWQAATIRPAAGMPARPRGGPCPKASTRRDGRRCRGRRAGRESPPPTASADAASGAAPSPFAGRHACRHR